MPRIDAHHHLWRFVADEYSWLEGELASLRRDFVEADLVETTRSAGVQGTIVVQARQTVEETEWLLRVAARTQPILGVVGWLPLREASLPSLLDRLSGEPLLKGLRHVVQAEPEGFMDEPAFRQGISQLAPRGLTYDLLIYEHQLDEAVRLVDAFPNLQFVIDHIAKPRIGSGDLRLWAEGIAALARRANTVCKISGMVTEAKSEEWSEALLRPYFDVVLEAFTPERLLFASDWPVVLARCSYAAWLDIVTGWIAGLSESEQSAILGENALRVYRVTSDITGVRGQGE